MAQVNGWQVLTPNAAYDWINQRDPAFENFVTIGNKKDANGETIFESYSLGVVTSRDPWVTSFSSPAMTSRLKDFIAFYNAEMHRHESLCAGLPKKEWPAVEDVLNGDLKRIAWTHNLKQDGPAKEGIAAHRR